MDKYTLLKNQIKKYKQVCVAFSGGVDSSLLLKAAVDALGENARAITIDGIMVSRRDMENAVCVAREIYGNDCVSIIKADALSIPEFKNNDRQRCYHCKKHLFGKLLEKANELGIQTVLDGKNADDNVMERPGAKAATELKVISPLADCGFTKQEVRETAKALGISSWDRPSNACLASRVPYHNELSEERLSKIERAEDLLHEQGFGTVRVRDHGNLARIEVSKDQFDKIISKPGLTFEIGKLGFDFVTLDLGGFKSGCYD